MGDPTVSQSDEALVEAFAGIIEGALIRHGVTDFEGTLDDARAILPIIAAREAAARAEGRREGIEEAAKVAEGVLGVNATAIRALAEKQP